MSVNMSFTINATNAAEISRGIRELAAILDASAREAGGTLSTEVAAKADPVTTITQAPDTPVSSPPEPPTSPMPPPAPAEAGGVSMEDVRAKLAALVQAGKQAEVRELLAAFGATKLSEIPAERYGELMEKAGAIG